MIEQKIVDPRIHGTREVRGLCENCKKGFWIKVPPHEDAEEFFVGRCPECFRMVKILLTRKQR